MTLVEHAKRELELIGQFDEDPAFAQAIVAAVAAFSSYGHSGGSAAVGIAMLYDLLQFKPLSAITDAADEWMCVADHVWQNVRDSSCFSNDGGKTYYDISTADYNYKTNEWTPVRSTRTVTESD